jgi:DNA-binding CsgD family transcriptional regulator
MSTATAKRGLIELEREAAEEGRQYGREKLRQRLQAIADEQGLICPGSGEHLQDARFRNLTLLTTLGQVSLRAHYGYDRLSQSWIFAVRKLWGLAPRQEISPHLEQQISFTAIECGSYQKAEQMARSWGVKIGATTIHKHVPLLGRQAQRQQELRTERALNPATGLEVTRQAQAQAPNALKEYNLVIMMDAWKGRERGPDWALKPADATGNRVEWRDLKLAVIYRLDQVVQKAPSADPATRPRRQILQKFWVATPSGTPPEEFGRQVHAEALRRGMAQAIQRLAASAGNGAPSADATADTNAQPEERLPDPARPSGELTGREREVMSLIARGYQTSEIAQLMSLSHKTVEKHRRILMRKLGLRSAAAVSASASNTGRSCGSIVANGPPHEGRAG